MSGVQPFSTLLALAERSQEVALELPPRENAQTHWNGLGFGLMGHRFVVPMGEIDELMRIPTYTRLPGVKPFVLGVANVRGRLMSLLDLAMFFEGTSAVPRSQRRVLAIEDGETYLGFLIDESHGMQHFPQDAFVSHTDIEEMFQPFVHGGYQVGNILWPILSLKSLAEAPGLEKLALIGQ